MGVDARGPGKAVSLRPVSPGTVKAGHPDAGRMPMIGAEPEEAPETRHSGKSIRTAFLLTVLTGWFGGHKFYFGTWTTGLYYLVFCWTGIPLLLSLSHARQMRRMSEGAVRERFFGEVAANEEADYLMKAHGLNGEVELHESTIRITRESLFARLAGAREGEFHVGGIDAVELKEPGLVTNGYVQFGLNERDLDSNIFEATGAFDAVTFVHGWTGAFRAIRDGIERRKAALEGD